MLNSANLADSLSKGQTIAGREFLGSADPSSAKFQALVKSFGAETSDPAVSSGEARLTPENQRIFVDLVYQLNAALDQVYTGHVSTEQGSYEVDAAIEVLAEFDAALGTNLLVEFQRSLKQSNDQLGDFTTGEPSGLTETHVALSKIANGIEESTKKWLLPKVQTPPDVRAANGIVVSIVVTENVASDYPGEALVTTVPQSIARVAEPATDAMVPTPFAFGLQQNPGQNLSTLALPREADRPPYAIGPELIGRVNRSDQFEQSGTVADLKDGKLQEIASKLHTDPSNTQTKPNASAPDAELALNKARATPVELTLRTTYVGPEGNVTIAEKSRRTSRAEAAIRTTPAELSVRAALAAQSGALVANDPLEPRSTLPLTPSEPTSPLIEGTNRVVTQSIVAKPGAPQLTPFPIGSFGFPKSEFGVTLGSISPALTIKHIEEILSSPEQAFLSRSLEGSMASEPTIEKQPVFALPRFSQAILTQLRIAEVSDGVTRVELAPRSLGSIEIEMRTTVDGSVSVVIRAENATVLTALRDMRDHLEQMLIMGQGGDLSFEDRPSASAQDREQSGGEHAESDNDLSESLQSLPAAPLAETVIGGGQLDLVT